MLLTSMYLAIGNSLNALPSQLGQLTMWRALVQARLCCFADFLTVRLKYTSIHYCGLCCGHTASHAMTVITLARLIQISPMC